MNILLDANVLLRLADPTSATQTIAATAASALRSQRLDVRSDTHLEDSEPIPFF
jgi:hypothetical protein